MRAVTSFVALVVLLVLALAANNWGLVIQRVPVDFVVTTSAVPLGLVLLVGLVLVAVAYFATIGSVRMQSAIESRDLHRELDKARRTADAAEASRFADLRAYLDREIPQIELKLDQALERLDVRVPVVPGGGVVR